MTDIEQARELLAAEYAMAGSTKRADKIIAGFDCAPGTEYALRAIATALRAAPEGFIERAVLSLYPDDRDSAIRNRARVKLHLAFTERVEKWMSPLSRVADTYGVTGTWDQIADAIIAAKPALSTVTPPRDLRTKLGDA